MLTITRTFISLLCVCVAVSFVSPAVAQPVEISICVSDSLAPDIVETLEQYPDACAQDDFFPTDWLRTTLEFFFVCRAIRIGGIEATYTFESYPNSARTIVQMKKGAFMIMVDLPWVKYTQDESLYQSMAVLRLGDFVKGIYTRPDHTALLNVKTLEELRNFKAVSNRVWFYDWEVLERMGVEKISVPKYALMGEMPERTT